MVNIFQEIYWKKKKEALPSKKQIYGFPEKLGAINLENLEMSVDIIIVCYIRLYPSEMKSGFFFLWWNFTFILYIGNHPDKN